MAFDLEDSSLEEFLDGLNSEESDDNNMEVHVTFTREDIKNA